MIHKNARGEISRLYGVMMSRTKLVEFCPRCCLGGFFLLMSFEPEKDSDWFFFWLGWLSLLQQQTTVGGNRNVINNQYRFPSTLGVSMNRNACLGATCGRLP